MRGESAAGFRRFDLDALMKGRKIVGYGAGFAFPASQSVWPLPVEYVVDDNEALHGHCIAGTPIVPTSRLASESPEGVFVIVYGFRVSSVLRISHTLNAMGFRFGENYLDCSYLHQRTVGERLASLFGIRPSYEKFAQSRLLSLYSAAKNLSTLAGTWLFVELADYVLPRVPGEVAELGVYNGGNAFVSLLVSDRLPERTYRLFDSFEGFGELGGRDPASRSGELGDVDFQDLQDMFANFPNVRVHKGYFSQTLPRLEEAQYSLVYLDCDLYSSTLECLEYFYHRMPPRGVLCIHDCWTPQEPLPKGVRVPFEGVLGAVVDFFGEGSRRLVVFPETTHAVMVKT